MTDAAHETAMTRLPIMVFKGVQNLPLLAARTKGFFAERGLDVDIGIAPNSWELRDGLAEGRYKIVHTAVDNALAMVHQAHIDVAIVLGGDDAFNALYVQPDITNYADLRGKTLLVDAPDTAYGLMLYAMLARKGLKRGDYAVKSVGATQFRLADMIGNADHKASMLNVPYSILGERAGLRRLDLAVDVLGPYQGTAGFVLRSWAKDNSDMLVRYIQAYVKGVRWALDRSNCAEAVALLTQAVEVPPDVAAEAYEIAAHPEHGMEKDARLDPEGFRNVLRIRAEFEGRSAAPPEDYLDLAYYERALAGL